MNLLVIHIYSTAPNHPTLQPTARTLHSAATLSPLNPNSYTPTSCVKTLYENKMEKNKLFVSGLPRTLTTEELEKTFSKYENKMEKNKLFVSGLPRTLTTEELEKTFSKFGKLKGVRIVTFKSGVPKGLAYVDFENEASATRAVMGLDNTQIGEHTITVAISNPPTRKAPLKDAAPAAASNPPERGQKSLGAK
eukprot:XP_011663361.1 PREDICTED: squamous cell carcinoma antigen recognized by T-cells 3-like [Strongylocentrotus purpuratus]